MAGNRKFYWLKLMHDYFTQPKIKKLRRIAGGDTYTIIYLKLQLLSLKTDGVLVYEGIEETIAEELALNIDEDIENVQLTLNYLLKHNMVEQIDDTHILMTETQSMIGSETAAASRVRKHRALKGKNEPVAIAETPKTNAQRQKMHRAKKACEGKQHIPFIEDYTNNKRYGGNYYIVMKRDKFKCAVCGSVENLCVHHIDGYSEEKPENNYENKLITVCRCCHSNIHAGQEINHDLLESIDYFYNSNEMLPGNTAVTNCNTEIELEREKEYIPAEAGDTPPVKSPDQLLTEEFNQIWDLYPNKKGRTKAFKKYKEYRTSTGSDYCTFDEVLKGLEKYLLYIEQNDIRLQFIKHGDTWFYNQCWLDDYIIEEPDPFKQQPEITEEESAKIDAYIKSYIESN